MRRAVLQCPSPAGDVDAALSAILSDDRGDTPAFRREVAAQEPLPSRLPS